MPTLVALKPHRYNGRLWRKGQTFEASGDDALVLRTLHVAADAPVNATPVATPDEPPPVKRPRGRPRKSTYETRAMVAAEPATVIAVPDLVPQETLDALDAAWETAHPSEPTED